MHLLRDVDDCDALRARLDRGGAVVVVGAGWIGSEFAASARQRGLDVTVVEPAALPLVRVLGDELGAIYRDIHADHGVRMLLGTGVEAFEGARPRRAGAHQRRAARSTATSSSSASGCSPRTQLAAAAGLDVDDGVVTDARLETSAPGVFAAGDVARAAHPFYDTRIRVEHWANALEQGPAAARSMLGDRAPYDRLPYFFSDQYDVGMEYRGYATDWDRVVFRGDPASREFIAFWLRGATLLAGMNVNLWDVGDDIEALLRAGTAVADARLADPDVPLAALAAEGSGRPAQAG